MRIVAGATVAVVFVLVLGKLNFFPKLICSAINNCVFHTAIVATVLVFRSKNQDDLDKKTNNHLPLPLDYASNEGKIIILFLHYMRRVFIIHLSLTKYSN